MNEKIDEAIKVLSKKISTDVSAGDALHFSQAILNLANAKGKLKEFEEK